jgi:DNA-binding transcriptional MerR regulator
VSDVTRDAEATLTIEQLAHETGMTVRNIRNHQTRGLLPAPEVRARTGYYGPQHVERLRLIQQMQAEGLKLSAIERLLGGEGDLAERLIGLRRAITAPVAAEAAEVISLAELEQRFGPASQNAKPLLKAQRLGLIINLGDGTFEVPSPALLRAAEDAVGRGVPLPAALAAIERVTRHAEAAAQEFVKLFMDELWKPFFAAGQPEEGWPEITEAVEQLRPVAIEALLAVFKPALLTKIEEAFGKALEEQARRKS